MLTQISKTELYSFFSRPFNIICDRGGHSYYRLTVVMADGVVHHVIDNLTEALLDSTLDRLKMRMYINPELI